MDHSQIDKRYLDTQLSAKERARILVSQMTLPEKIAQMLHKAPPIPRLDVPAYNWWNECLHGAARSGRATVFPQAIGMAATFNIELMSRTAEIISDEARAKHHQALKQDNRGQYFGLTPWSPNINIFRDPRWGRGQETYGECPYLTSRLGVAFVRGLQGSDPKYLKLVATPKHYAVHSGPESLRHTFDAVVSPRDLRETYLPAFKATVQEGGAWSVMGAYNRTNGEPCCGSHTLIQKILREEWGFAGYYVSDCWAIRDFHENHKVTSTPEESVAMAVRNGCDLNCGDIYPRLREAEKLGLITEAEITVCAERLFEARFKLGMFDPEDEVPFSHLSPDIVHSEAHVAHARQVARESIVLLKNEGNLLPLKRNINGIAVVGPAACTSEVLLANYNGFSPNLVTILEGIIGEVSVGTQVTYTKGCDFAGLAPINEGHLKTATDAADVIIATLGYSPLLEGEEGDAAGELEADGSGDRTRIGLPGRQLELLQKLHALGKPVVLLLTGGSPIELKWAAENIPAILMVWYPGEQGGQAAADVLFGDYNPAGRLPVTFVKDLEQLPAFTEYAMKGRTYRFMTEEPLYPFGYGLSYTTFAYSKLQLSRATIGVSDPVSVTVSVRNTGARAGDEVVQLYVKDLQSSVPVPFRQLAGISRVHLQPGEEKQVTLKLKPEQLAAYDDAGQPFVEPGEFEISVGGGQPTDSRSVTVQTILTVK
jgi:beta-glucosidase